MAVELLRRGVLDHRRALAGWCVGVAAYVAAPRGDLPVHRGLGGARRARRELPGRAQVPLRDLGRRRHHQGAGFIDAELFSFMLPLFALVLAIGSGARTLAGEEDAGRLELVLALPRAAARGRAGEGRSPSGSRSPSSARRPSSRSRVLEPALRARPAARAARGRGRRASASLGLLHGWLAARGRRRRAEPGARDRRPGGARRGRLPGRRACTSSPVVARPVPLPLELLVDRPGPAAERLRGWGVLVVAVAALAIWRRRCSSSSGATSRCLSGRPRRPDRLGAAFGRIRRGRM